MQPFREWLFRGGGGGATLVWERAAHPHLQRYKDWASAYILTRVFAYNKLSLRLPSIKQ